jgi:NDP-sugar pyrophosphorylase family protein
LIYFSNFLLLLSNIHQQKNNNMSNPVIHFEMGYFDRERMKKFYESAFGWKMQQMGADMGNYVVAQTAETDEKGMVKTPGTINGGFFVLHPDALDLIDDDDTPWERGPMERLAASDNLRAWDHDGFWQPMDTLRDRQTLERLWASGEAPWKVWH